MGRLMRTGTSSGDWLVFSGSALTGVAMVAFVDFAPVPPLTIGAAAAIVLALRSARLLALSTLLAGVGAGMIALAAIAPVAPVNVVWVAIGAGSLVLGGALAFVRARRLAEPARPERHLHVGRAFAAGLVTAIAVAALGLPVRPGEHGLPTTPPTFGMLACGGVGLDAVLHGNPNDPRVTWLENRIGIPAVSQPRLEIEWPSGYRARFTPTLEVVDGWGNVVAREGDLVDGTCKPTEPFLVGPGDVHHP